MRAVVCNSYGPPETLVLADIPSPGPKEGEVIVAIAAAGLNYPDALKVLGQYQEKPPLPFVPGGEGSGVITRVGAGIDPALVGARVYSNRFNGSFAEEAALTAAHVKPIPEGLSFEQAAVLSTTYETTYYALVSLAALKPGETVLVLGAAGGVGLAAVEIARALGARVIAAASTAEKLAVSAAHGAQELINYSTEDLRERLRQLTGKDGVDVVYDPVGGAYAEPALRALAWRGRYLVIGFASGSIPKLPLNLVLLKAAAVLGVFLGQAWNREPEIIAQVEQGVARLAAAGRLKLHVSARYAMADTKIGLRALLDRRMIGKAVMLPR